MKRCIRSVTLALTALLLAVWSAPCSAVESPFKEVLTDSLYGGLTGTLVGAAVMAFTSKPGKHLDYMAYGGAVGVLTGAAFGFGKALIEMNNGKVRFSMPTVIPDIQETNSKGQTPVVITTKLFHGAF